jgi:putative FmdB family regulatory protein
MPVYEYKCQTCTNTRTVTHGIEDNHQATCACGQPMIKVYYSPPIIFKGNGWAAKEK